MTQQRAIRFLLLLGGLFLAGCSRPGTALTSSPVGSKVDALERVTENGPVKLTIRVTPPEPRLSDLLEMDVLVVAQPGVEVKPPAFGQAVGDFVVRDYSERKEKQNPTPTAADEPTTHRFHYQLEPMHAGRHLVRSLAIEFVDNRVNSAASGKTALIESDPLEIQITSELGDQLPDLANLEPMLPPRPLKSTRAWWWLVALILGGIVAAFVYRFRQRRRLSRIEPRRPSPEQIAHAALAALLAEGLPAKGLVKEFYLRLTGIVRQYIEGTTGLKAPEQTTEEFLRAMRSQEVFPPQRSARLTEFLEAADMVKYAGQQPDESQIALSIVRAHEFIDLPSVPAESQPSKSQPSEFEVVSAGGA